jgi:hypothetical protein
MPTLKESLLREAHLACGNSTSVRQMKGISGANEIDNLGSYPHESIGNEILLHFVALVGIAGRVQISRTHESHAIELKTSFSPQYHVVGIQPGLRLVDDWIKYSLIS